MFSRVATIKVYAGFWLGTAILTGVWLVIQDIQFTQCCRGRESDMAIGITEFVYGWTAIVTGVNALLLLIFRNNVIRMVSAILIGITTTLFFLSIPLLSIVCLAAAIYVIVCIVQASKQPSAPAKK